MKLIPYILAVLPLLPLLANTNASSIAEKNITITNTFNSSFAVTKKTAEETEYAAWNVSNEGLSYDAFTNALKGYHYFAAKNLLNNTNVLTVIDYSKASIEKRLFVLDVVNKKILYKTWVAHGQQSGLNYATNFSNTESSHQTSLGFFITLNTYTGEHGYSLKLKGCEAGINNNAFERAIVVHAADYVNEKIADQQGYMGRSFGCPAIPTNMHKKIIDVIKNGSCMFLYHPTKKYTTVSKILNN
jgi:L,D-transpeptidase catalytic domain